MSVGIKESLELLEGLKDLVLAGKKVIADGKVSVSDLNVVVDLFHELNVLVDAVKGVSQIPAEVKDLDSEELGVLGAKVLEIVNAVRVA